MKKPKKQLEPWQIEDAARLKSLFEKRAGRSQAEFGAEFEIGSQGMVWQYLNAHRPLNLKAAHGFARGMRVRIEEFSPTLAAEFQHAFLLVTSHPDDDHLSKEDVFRMSFDELMNRRNLIVHGVSKEVTQTDHDKAGAPRATRATRARTTDSAENLPLFDESIPVIPFHTDGSPALSGTQNVSDAPQYSIDKNDFRPVYVIEWPQGGMPERLWTDGEQPVGVTDRFAVLATTDPRAFLAPVVGTSMVPRFNPGEFALVEPGIDPELEDDVLVRLNTGETLLRRLVSRRGGIQLAAYNEPGTALYAETDITWMLYVAHTVPARKIRHATK